MKNRDSERIARDLLRSLLIQSQALKLSSDQLSSLNRIYWAYHHGERDQLTTRAIANLVSYEQFVGAISALTTDGGADRSDNSHDAEVEAIIEKSVSAKFMDKDLLAIDLASTVTERLIDWAKIFAFFVAAPIALMLIILSVFGFQKVQDIRAVSDRADAIVATAETKFSQLSDTNKKIALFDSKVHGLEAEIEQRRSSVEQQIAFLDKEIESVRLLSQATAATSVLTANHKTVQDLQVALKDKGFYKGDINGKYDVATSRALEEFQLTIGSAPDGLIGRLTYMKLFGAQR